MSELFSKGNWGRNWSAPETERYYVQVIDRMNGSTDEFTFEYVYQCFKERLLKELAEEKTLERGPTRE